MTADVERVNKRIFSQTQVAYGREENRTLESRPVEESQCDAWQRISVSSVAPFLVESG